MPEVQHPAPVSAASAWRLPGRVARGAVTSTWQTSVWSSVALHAIALGGIYAGSWAWSSGSWRLVPPRPGVNSIAIEARHVVEVAAPLASDAEESPSFTLPPASPPLPSPADLAVVRPLERSAVSQPVAQATPVEPTPAERAAAPASVQLAQRQPASQQPALPPASPRASVARESRDLAVITAGDTKAELPRRSTARASAASAGSSGAATLPAPLYNPRPTYPPDLMAAGIEGVVKLRVELNAAGRVTSAKVAKSSGYAAFDRSALAIIYRWRFTADSDRQPKPRALTVPIRFGIVR